MGAKAIIGVIVALIVYAIPKLVIGGVYLHDCRIQNKIPIFLIITALSPILFAFIVTDNKRQMAIGVGAVLINVAMVFCESIWVFVTYDTVHKETYVPCNSVNGTNTPPGCTEGTCNDTLLNFSFAMNILDWLCIIIVLSVAYYKTCKQSVSSGLY